MTKKIILWSTPRSISTAFERAMREIDNAKIFHEPYVDAYYLGPERTSKRYSHLEVKPEQTFNSIDEKISKDFDVDVVFAKEQAFYMEEDYTRVISKAFKDYQHTFLIRDPRQAVVSLYKASIDEKGTGWNYFDANEAGYKQLQAVYNIVKENIDQNPVIVDAADLLTNPEETIKEYTRATQISYTPYMVQWREKRIEDYDNWDGWYDTLFKSKGFIKKTRVEAERYEDISKFPQDVQECIRECLPIYQTLKSFKLSINDCNN